MIRSKGKLWCCGEEIKTHGTDTETENTSLLSFFLTVYLGRFSPPTCHISPRSHSSSIYLLYVHRVIFFVSLLRSITLHLISMKPQTTNIWEEKQPLRDEKRLGGTAIIVRLDSFVFTRLLSFLLLCVINIERAWRTDGGMRDGWRDGGTEGGVFVLSSRILFPNRHN